MEVIELKRHDALAQLIGNRLRSDLKCDVKFEQIIPELSRTTADGVVEEGRMDMVVNHISKRRLLDVTVVNPKQKCSAERNVEGNAVQKAALDKRRRYNNLSIPLAFEAGGKVVTEGKDFLNKV